MQHPLEEHWIIVKRILRYLAGTKSYGIKFSKSFHLNLIGFYDADLGNDLDDHKLVT